MSNSVVFNLLSCHITQMNWMDQVPENCICHQAPRSINKVETLVYRSPFVWRKCWSCRVPEELSLTRCSMILEENKIRNKFFLLNLLFGKMRDWGLRWHRFSWCSRSVNEIVASHVFASSTSGDFDSFRLVLVSLFHDQIVSIQICRQSPRKEWQEWVRHLGLGHRNAF